MKKIAAVLLAVILALTVFSCKKSNGSDSDSTSENTSGKNNASGIESIISQPDKSSLPDEITSWMSVCGDEQHSYIGTYAYIKTADGVSTCYLYRPGETGSQVCVNTKNEDGEISLEADYIDGPNDLSLVEIRLDNENNLKIKVKIFDGGDNISIHVTRV